MLLGHGYLGHPKLCVSGGVLLKLLVPVAFEVDGVDQHQPGITGYKILSQKVLDFTWRTDFMNALSALMFYICDVTETLRQA